MNLNIILILKHIFRLNDKFNKYIWPINFYFIFKIFYVKNIYFNHERLKLVIFEFYKFYVKVKEI